MFRIPIPLFTWLGGLTKVLYDRELAISERKVKPASILQNSSLILGKQIIHILPEGSAILNPEDQAFCISSSKPSIALPIQINQTTPIQIDMLRIDLDTNDQEKITVSAKEIKKLKRHADRKYDTRDLGSPQILYYPIKKSGVYRLQRVVDESKLEVQRRHSDATVVKCPKAIVQNVPKHKCKGELSDFRIEVEATPPVKIRYSKLVNREDQGHAVLNVHPEHQSTHFTLQRATEGQLISADSVDVAWARTQTVYIPMNESLGTTGGWQYLIDEVSDALGNVANYSELRTQDSHPQKKSRMQLEQHFLIHERPRVALHGCDVQHPIKAEIGKYKSLPVQVRSKSPSKLDYGPYTLTYLFTPQSDMLPGQKHAESAQVKETTVRDSQRGVEVREPGLYTLLSIASEHCEGEVLEPSSCALVNPAEPDLNIVAEPISDKCAGNAVGLMVSLDLIGTPPFRVHYTIKEQGRGVTPKYEDVDRFHWQLEFRPLDTGHYTYEFTRISDAVYNNPQSLSHKSLILEQDIKAPASAHVYDPEIHRTACIDQTATVIVQLSGEPPFTLEYELVHGSNREKFKKEAILENAHYLTTGALSSGREHVLALTSLTDESGCKTALQTEIRIDVSLQRPRASFGSLDGSRIVNALEDKQVRLPLRLQGEAPWTLHYVRLKDPQKVNSQVILRHSNDYIEVEVDGIYELVDVHDASCPGTVDLSASQFTIKWIPRPFFTFPESPLIDRTREKLVRNDVCQGDEDAIDVSFEGTAPFNYEYMQRLKSSQGSQSVTYKKFSSGLHQASIEMETSEAGLYEYTMIKLGDLSYNHDNRRFRHITIEQRVHPRPSASFVDTGKTYRYCQEEDIGGEIVPINLVGQPPFHLELEVKHQAVTHAEVITVPHVESNRFNFQVPSRLRALGVHLVAIRKVQDARGCQRQMDRNAPHVLVSIAELPSISPLEERRDFCVGDRISYSLSGTPPFSVFYHFEGRERKASVPMTDFRRIAEKPGIFVITAVSDQRSTDTCRVRTELTKIIHEMPSVRVSKGRTATVDIHEGGEAEILFEFGGKPPFHFT